MFALIYCTVITILIVYKPFAGLNSVTFYAPYVQAAHLAGIKNLLADRLVYDDRRAGAAKRSLPSGMESPRNVCLTGFFRKQHG